MRYELWVAANVQCLQFLGLHVGRSVPKRRSFQQQEEFKHCMRTAIRH